MFWKAIKITICAFKKKSEVVASSNKPLTEMSTIVPIGSEEVILSTSNNK